MANRKRPEDRTVNASHMPRKNGPCKKSPDGFHAPTVVAREVVHVMDRSHWRAMWAPQGYKIIEDVKCEHCGKSGQGQYSNNMITPDYVRDTLMEGPKTTTYTSLHKVNDQMKSKS